VAISQKHILKQFLVCFSLVVLAAALSYSLQNYIDYKVAAFILLVTVSLVAMFFDILPVLAAAALSAVIWNFFFIPPRHTFRIGSTEDNILFLMYFLIASVNAVLTYKIRRMEKQAQKRTEKANIVKLYDTLLNSLSHELRTPISAIIGATDNLQTNGDRISEEHKTTLINEIAKASFRLNQQVENLLNMSRLESGFIQPKKDWCDINEVVYGVVKRLEENDVPQHISININPAILLFKLDKGMLEQVIYNLVNNAIQYTPKNSKIDIMAMAYTDLLHLVIEDNGPGFPEDEIDHVFDKFYRLKNSKAGGTGLGLSIVKGFVEAMGGSVSLKNISTGGARFTVEIPAETTHSDNLENNQLYILQQKQTEIK
jgi:two-component system, OmpR family, sensor histidine kinase KdpD